MKPHRRVILIVLLVLLALAVVGTILTSNSVQISRSESAANARKAEQAALVDQTPLERARGLARLAVTPEEQEFARTALRVADHEVDLAFDSALRYATTHPVSLTPEARELQARVKQIQVRVKADKDDVARLKESAAKASEGKKDSLQEQLDLAEAQLALDQDELDDAQQDLIRAGGDRQSTIQRMLDAHEAAQEFEASGAASATNLGNTGPTDEATQSHSVVAQFRAWWELNGKKNELLRAQGEASAGATELTAKHEALGQEIKAAASSKPGAGQQASSSPAGNDSQENAGSNPPAATIRSALQVRTENEKNLRDLDQRVEDLQDLTRNYGSWIALVQSRQRTFLHGLLVSTVSILAIGVLMLLADPFLHRVISRAGSAHKQLLTLRSLLRFAVHATGFVLILLVIFGPPNQLATVLALAAAGLTVALKDFIVGFFGWFILMGRNGIRPGDWVEINGVGGEVLELGLLHTVLLEAGNRSDAGHPTGRKVTFVNSYPIEGHYFNFSTSGEWLWDELEVFVPQGADPYPLAEAIQKIVAADTNANARLAEQEWQRVVPGPAKRTFSMEPATTVRPTNFGANVIVRYITRANERHEVRARLYHDIVGLLHQKNIPTPSPVT